MKDPQTARGNTKRLGRPGSRTGLRCAICDKKTTKTVSASEDKIHYSIQGVRQDHNEDHGDALKAFYGHYRLLDYDPENTITRVSDSPFWVKIVN
jgi:hypothetical protein